MRLFHTSRLTHHASRITFFVTLLVLLLAAGNTQAQEPVTDNEVNEVARDIYCPVCENVPLDVCPTQACADWRALIREQLSEGHSKQEIIEYFAERYGDRIRSAPPRQGFNWLAWLLPIVGVVAGVFLFGRYVYGLQKPAGREVQSQSRQMLSPPGVEPDYLERLERELREEE